MIFGGLITISNYGTFNAGPIPPPGSFFMITEVDNSLMTDESGNLMITE